MLFGKRWIYFILPLWLLLTGAIGTAYAQVPENPDEDFVIASVMTASPGDELYSKLGHAFIRMRCPSHAMDFCFTYESEDATDKVMSFLSGNLKMGMMGIPTGEFLKHYEDEGREVKEYELNLPVAVKQNMWRILDRYVAEGTNLPYDYMKRGCAYSVYKVIQEASERGKLSFGTWPSDFEMTRRELVCSQLDESPWTRLFLNIITNGPIDDEVSPQEKIITPKHLVQALQGAKYDGHPLLKGEPATVLPQVAPEEKAAWLSPMKLVSLIVILTLVCLVAGKVWMLYFLLALQTILGVFVVYLLLFSSLCATEWSWLVIPFNPLPLLCWRWRRQWEIPYAAVLLVWVVTITFGGRYLMDAPLILLALSLCLAYTGDELRRRQIFIKTGWERFKLILLKKQRTNL